MESVDSWDVFLGRLFGEYGCNDGDLEFGRCTGDITVCCLDINGVQGISSVVVNGFGV